jgi:hypothetical protein
MNMKFTGFVFSLEAHEHFPLRMLFLASSFACALESGHGGGIVQVIAVGPQGNPVTVFDATRLHLATFRWAGRTAGSGHDQSREDTEAVVRGDAYPRWRVYAMMTAVEADGFTRLRVGLFVEVGYTTRLCVTSVLEAFDLAAL